MIMIKFSIVVPVYNVEKYVEKCLYSLKNQTYKNFEVILVCDKSTDKTNDIVDKFVKKDKRFIKIYEEHTGLARAKNLGVEKSNGDYIVFLDGDDYIELDLLDTLIKEKIQEYDIVRYQAREVKNNEVINEFNEEGFDNLNGVEAFNKIIRYHYIENSWLYAYNAMFFKNHNFKFAEGCIAEDYGLTPLIIAYAKNIKSIIYIGYNYVQRDNSLMNNSNYDMRIKKMEDMLNQASYLKIELNQIDNSSRVVEFINNSLIYYSTTLNYKDYRRYNKLLKEQGCFKHLKGENFRNSIRCFLIRFNSYFFFRIVNRGK